MKAGRELAQAMTALGYSVKRHGKHVLWAHPSGATVTTPYEPGTVRSMRNSIAQGRRELRAKGVSVPD